MLELEVRHDARNSKAPSGERGPPPFEKGKFFLEGLNKFTVLVKWTKEIGGGELKKQPQLIV